MEQQRKRTANIDLRRMRKGFSPKPLALGVATVLLSACGGNKQDATVYTSANDCIDKNPEFAEQCMAAYEQALQEAAKTAPKYGNERDCEYDFGQEQCRAVETSSGSFFMPFMAGYMLSNLMSPRGYYSQPLFTSYSPYSSYRYRWTTADGWDYGYYKDRKLRVGQDAFKPKPAVNKTIKRGGFGSSVRAKSSWGSSSKGWGG
ncbi:DUF1190 family protein [Bowmanella dokdonensis]|uniref:DUF1190 family protein n=1 Tax=Bowmanella dokdonensis TaxID=751969 RepID=A0A939DQN6_9ALTE|nr:DUF1190 family protein [Bowmanella dokdonensis]MBN7826450.1 DUF1190 family protein [Bowmanella dokdonensis]